jgi:hypothetical protein
MLGSRDAMSAALVASAMADKGEVKEAHSIFRTQRFGDALGVFMGNVVKARVVASHDEAQATSLLERALQDVQDLPKWTRTSRLRAWGITQSEALAAAAEGPELREIVAKVAAWFNLLPADD